MISEFEKEKVFWTRKMNLNLVKFIETKPNIWNPKHPKYTSVESKDQTYAEFASKYGNEFTGQAVKDRWTNIRSTFATYVRKIKASRAKGDGEVYKVTWHLWDACRFLLKVNKKNKSANSDGCTKDRQDDTKNVSNENDDKLPNIADGEQDISCLKLANGILNVFRCVQNDVFDIDNTKYGDLGHKIASSLSKMDSYEAAQMSNKIMDILLLYHEDNPSNPNNLQSEAL